MNNQKIIVNNKSIGFVGLLQIAFIILKLCNVIKWSWVCVFLPLIISVGLIILLLLIYIILAIIANK